MQHNTSYHYRRTGLSQGLHSMGVTNVGAWCLSLYNADPAKFLCRYITMDETWAHCFNPETKLQTKASNHSTASQIPQDCLRWQSCRICIFGQWGCSHDWLLGEGKDCYGQLLCGINQKTSYSYPRKAKLCCFITTTHQPTLLLLPQLLFETAVSNCWITRRILQTRLHLTSMCSDLWKIRYMDRHLRVMKLSFMP